MGGFAHLATLVKRLRASRPQALLLDGGDSWQGSATALWTRGADMMGAQQRLGVDYMTAHWEFTYGQKRDPGVRQFKVLAQNVRTADFEDPVFEAYALRSVNGVPVAIIGQAFPYTPIANPRYFVADWTFGIQEGRLQKIIDEVRAKGARVVVLLSHNGSHVDLKLAGRVRGLDAILGGHTHDPMPAAGADWKHTGHERRLAWEISRRPGPAGFRRRARRTSAIACCRCFRGCSRQTPRWLRTLLKSASRTRQN